MKTTNLAPPPAKAKGIPFTLPSTPPSVRKYSPPGRRRTLAANVPAFRAGK